MVMVGPPGTAKSALVRAFADTIDARYYDYLLTRFTEPNEIFGPVDIQAFRQGSYRRRVEGMLPEAEIAFLDEIFKANSAILNSLLTILNERRFHHGSQTVAVPLQSLIAASNELPEEDELGALYDRFLLRYAVGYIEEDHRFLRLLELGEEPAAERTALSADELATLQAGVKAVRVPGPVLEDILDVRRELAGDGVVASDRRYRQALDVLRAAALLEGRDAVTPFDLGWLEHILWSDPEQKPKVANALAKVATGHEQEAQTLLAQAQEIASYARRRWPDIDSRNRAIIEAHTKLHHILARLSAMREAGQKRSRDTSRIDHIAGQVQAMQEQLISVRN
jgi:MoxR-like ATPase